MGSYHTYRQELKLSTLLYTVLHFFKIKVHEENPEIYFINLKDVPEFTQKQILDATIKRCEMCFELNDKDQIVGQNCNWCISKHKDSIDKDNMEWVCPSEFLLFVDAVEAAKIAPENRDEEYNLKPDAKIYFI